jgi:exopolysaccharide biosynthesis polyprenyl glycosylphosphotransferase
VEPSNINLLEEAEASQARPRRGGLRAVEREATAARSFRAVDAVVVWAFLLDVAMLSVACLASTVSASATGMRQPNLAWLALFSVLTLALLAYNGTYRWRFAPHFLDDVRAIVAATAVAAISVTFLRVLVADDPSAASEAVRMWLFASMYLAAARGGVQLVSDHRRRQGLEGERTLILGAGHVGTLVARRLAERPEFGLKPVAFLDHDPLHADKASLPIIGQGSQAAEDPETFAEHLESAVRDFTIQHVIVTFSLSSHEVELALVRRCQQLGVKVSLVPRLFEGIPDQTVLERIGGLPLISVHPTDPKGWQFGVKYAADRIFAAIAILLLSPLMIFAAVGTWLTIGRPILFRQRRMGIDGHVFEMLKFRTMRGPVEPEAEEEPDEIPADLSLAPGGVEGDDRRSRFGVLLRRSAIDELPQLLNVLRGDMSLIGPRPERPGFAAVFNQAVRRYADRHRVKSGITGWAQVHRLRGKTSLADRVEWDNYYIENWSLWLDFKIVLLTIRAVFRDRVE